MPRQSWRPRAANGLTPVAKSRICVASLRCSSVKYVEYSPSSRLGLLASPQFRSVFKPFGALARLRRALDRELAKGGSVDHRHQMPVGIDDHRPRHSSEGPLG